MPKSSRQRVAGWMGDALKVCVTAAPERGQANEAVRVVLAEALGLSPQSVQLVAGGASARKIFDIAGLDKAEVRRRLEASGIK